MHSSRERRDFAKQTLGSLLTYSLLETVVCSDALAESVKPIAANWLADVDRMSRDLKGNKLDQVQWQGKVEDLFSQIDLAEFLSYIDFEQLTAQIKFRERGEKILHASFPEVAGLPTKLVFGHQIFALTKDRSVVPHGHHNMATAFLVLDGQFKGKHYDRLEDHDDHMIVKPTIDRDFTAGQCSTISDYKDNVHWFKATSDQAFIFNIHVLHIDPSINKTGRVYIDPFGEKLAGGLIKAPKLKAKEARLRFG
ncbi:MAG: hypothetical protein HKN47_22130 [Pirellulaceae bacterium]|nr:hypothetical protein [Pirellulaceae bacterium]